MKQDTAHKGNWFYGLPVKTLVFILMIGTVFSAVMWLMAAFAIRAGADAELARAILDCVMTEEMLRLMHDRGIMERAMRLMGERIDYYVRHRIKDQISVGVVVFHETYGILCTTGPAAEWIEEMRKQNEET